MSCPREVVVRGKGQGDKWSMNRRVSAEKEMRGLPRQPSSEEAKDTERRRGVKASHDRRCETRVRTDEAVNGM